MKKQQKHVAKSKTDKSKETAVPENVMAKVLQALSMFQHHQLKKSEPKPEKFQENIDIENNDEGVLITGNYSTSIEQTICIHIRTKTGNTS